MNANLIREKFIDFFEKRGHKIVASDSLVPKDDPSVLLTTAGMQQFKPYYTGKKDPRKDFGSERTVSVQKSFRTSDIEEIGDDSHLTFFEMLGNFSFGDYFKEETLKWGYEFITEVIGITSDRISVTVFEGDKDVGEDKESIEIWKKIGLPEDKIKKAGREDNFWGPTGEEGPCGPTSEIYVDGLEIWNMVFNQFYCHKDGTLETLSQSGVDTGMGLERLVKVSQEVPTIFETDLFSPLMEIIEKGSVRDFVNSGGGSSSFEDLFDPHQAFEKNMEKALGKAGEMMRSIRIVADHLRGGVFLFADDLMPSNVGAGFILRRIIRRAVRHGRLIGFSEWDKAINWIVSEYGKFYPELRKGNINKEFRKEKEKFEKALEKGIKKFDKMVEKKRDLGGEDAFYLYESFGFPLEMLRELTKERGIRFDEKGFEEAFQKHQKVSRAGVEKKFGGHGLIREGELSAASKEELQVKTRFHTATHLLQQALKDVLGEKVRQRGSDINAERLRFDFSHDRKLTEGEIKKVENIVNEKIGENLKIKKEKMTKNEAIERGALYVEGGEYPDFVSVYSILNKDGSVYSMEICGGPHMKATGEIGSFKILKEEASSAGVRRLKAKI